jgi:hypothetical protein
MSGVEIVAAAAAVSLVASGVSAYSQIQIANQSAEMQEKQIREQQVQLRLQENQSTIDRMKKLQQVLATEEVSLGVRHIAANSGSVRAVTMENMHNFIEDENADKLNYAAKQLALGRSITMVRQQRNAQVFGAATGFIKEGAGTVMAVYGVPSQSLIDKSAGGGGVSNVGGSYGAQSYMGSQRNQFNLNA